MAASSSAPAPPPWVILGRLAIPWRDDAEDPEDVSVTLVPPPRVSTLTVPTSIHPDPSEHDKHPYVVATDAAGLLLHLYHWPFIGFDLDTNPEGIFVVVRGFVPVVASKLHEPTATAIRVPDRRLQPAMPTFSSIRNVGLVSRPGSGGADYIVAELQIVKVNSADRATARLLYFRSGNPEWVVKDLPFTGMVGCPTANNGWTFDDVISHDGKLWWVSLVWGLLCCDLFDEQPLLLYHIAAPEAMATVEQHCPQDIERNCCVRVSKGKLRYVKITGDKVDPIGQTVVVMWTMDAGKDGLMRWELEYETTLGEIWADDSYRAIGMPEEIPALAAVHPRDPSVVYFFLRQRLFGVNVREHRVVEFVHEPPSDGVEVGAGNGTHPPPPLSWRFVLAWELPPSLTEGYCFSEELEDLPIQNQELEDLPVQNEELENLDVNPPAEECGSSATVPSPDVMSDTDK